MRKLRKAAVVVVMVGSVGMFGAGSAFANDMYGSEKGYGHHESEKGHHDSDKGWDKGDKGHHKSKKEEALEAPDFIVNNPQYMDCSYTENSASLLSQATVAAVGGASTQTMNLGNVCAQTGPVFGDGED
ncbi:hypothetical protein [Streptomyces meridianus]|uniref:Secreted protein n=1 Tax=Streptomyces meridianus TaxID=2938945 RepID=A0ABT0X0N3_9ACTN|nr:hypothetical protein [Streptomyces meridianus]MCM2576121.1 hypothetical protein [Streptomyces meridianus]